MATEGLPGRGGRMRLAVIGAGPVGLELALAAARRGVEVELFERSAGPAGHVEAYHFVRLFSPWSLNTTAEGLQALRELGVPLPDPSAFPTGRELLDGYLSPLLRAVQASEHCAAVHLGTEVLAIGRGALLKSESIGGGEMQMPRGVPQCQLLRRETPFRLLVLQDGAEHYVEGFDAVVDCSGFYRSENAGWMGMGGVPALGERKLRRSGRLWATVPDVLGADRTRFAGRRTLVLGAGMSAATVLRDLTTLRDSEQGTDVLFVTRKAGEPFTVIPEDVLPQRLALCELGNRAARGEVAGVEHIGGAAVVRAEELAEGRLEVTLACHGLSEPRVVLVDELVACVGYHPDGSIHEELQVHQCYASNGPMKLAATLLGGSGDCLAQVSAGADSLMNPEPGFFILGSKSYGRKSAFLLKIGHEQIRAVLDLLAPSAGAAV